MADDRRPSKIACAHCGRKVRVAKRGRTRVFCSDSCRSMAFVKNKRGTKVAAEDRQRLLMWGLLQDAGLVPADQPLPPKRKTEDQT